MTIVQVVETSDILIACAAVRMWRRLVTYSSLPEDYSNPEGHNTLNPIGMLAVVLHFVSDEWRNGYLCPGNFLPPSNPTSSRPLPRPNNTIGECCTDDANLGLVFRWFGVAAQLSGQPKVRHFTNHVVPDQHVSGGEVLNRELQGKNMHVIS